MNNTSTAHCAVVGNPIAHSLSPQIHHAFAQSLGLNVRYERILSETQDFDTVVHQFFTSGGRGLNITVPFKEQAFALADDKSPRARLAGAVNTLWMSEGRLQGCNTDGEGLVYDMQRLNTPPKDQRILIIGAGGATRGVLIPLLEAGARNLKIINRTPARAAQIADELCQQQPQYEKKLSVGSLQDTDGQWDIVINATSASLGSAGLNHGPIEYSPTALAYDMVYGAQPTAFMQQARTQGAQHTADGLGMLVEQAASSFAIWFGQRPPTTAVRQALRTQLQAAASRTP
ncbi:MAG TPA: shikimate dehydrogenase [Paenalcaligenes sp.]|nr:shikimate dehydrogenase [Paenalcaligenes sp.]